MTYKTLDIADKESVRIIKLSRPDRLNAFTLVMAEELIRAFAESSEDDTVRVIIVTGEGRAFCAGMDLSGAGNVFGLDESKHLTLADMDDRYRTPEYADGVRDSGGRVALAILQCKKPVIAAINGPAVGIGATMTLAMDVRLASDAARIGFVFGRVGIVPEACSTWLLPKLVGISQALEWMYRADPFTADEGKRGGLIRDVLPADKLMESAFGLAQSFIDGKSAVSVAMIRQMVYRSMGQDEAVLAHKVESLGVFQTSLQDGKEGVAAFLARRKPDFKAKPSKDMPAVYPW